MIQRTVLGFAAIGLLLTGANAPRALAGAIDHETIFAFNAPLEIPGRVLPPGTYVFQRLDDDVNILQIFTKDRQHLIATLMMMPQELANTPSQARVTLSEAKSGNPEALVAWIYPGDSTAEEFSYPQAGGHNHLVAQNRVVGSPVR